MQPLAEKLILTVCWNYKRIIHQKYIVKKTIKNSQKYVETLRKLKRA